MEYQSKKAQKILIVDDSEMNRQLLAEILKDDFEIVEVENGVQAISYIQLHLSEIALILLDIVMPEMDGFEVLMYMNKYHWVEEVPVMMISAENTSQYIERAYGMGVVDFISRPFHISVVRQRIQNTIALYAKQRRLVNLVVDQIKEKEKSNAVMILILSHIVEFRNGESGLHVMHINIMTEMLLKKLAKKTDKYHLTEREIELISVASSLHDIGKISIPEEVLNKPGRLTPEEFERVKKHSEIGAAMLDTLPDLKNEELVRLGYEICRWHHERYDGKGYPDGLKGEEIPISAQVVALADVYDALISERCYKKAYSHEKAMQMILNGECGTFQPLLLECLQDISLEIERELSVHSLNSMNEGSIKRVAEEVMAQEDLGLIDHMQQQLESTKVKLEFLEETAEEILFTYYVDPPLLIMPVKSAEKMGLREYVPEPLQSEEVKACISASLVEEIQEKVKDCTFEAADFEIESDLLIDGKVKKCYFKCRSLWMESGKSEYDYKGITGKIIEPFEGILWKRGGRGQAEILEAYNEKLYKDAITAVYNRRYYEENVRDLSDVSAVAMLDVDDFKRINDVCGHRAGDEALHLIAGTIKACIRGDDYVVRYGGDEFAIIFPVIPKEFFNECLERICGRIEQLKLEGYPELNISASIGGIHGEGCVSDMLEKADRLMYKAKRRRNRMESNINQEEETQSEGETQFFFGGGEEGK